MQLSLLCRHRRYAEVTLQFRFVLDQQRQRIGIIIAEPWLAMSFYSPDNGGRRGACEPGRKSDRERASLLPGRM
jgi:hypothetical protein